MKKTILVCLVFAIVATASAQTESRYAHTVRHESYMKAVNDHEKNPVDWHWALWYSIKRALSL